MMDLQLAGLQELSLNRSSGDNDYNLRLVSVTRRRFDALCYQARVNRMVDRMIGQERGLICLAQATAGRAARSTIEVGILSVELTQIIGSEGRACDFDRNWRPLNDGCRERWMRIAMAYESGASLPPVKLVEVDGAYYVRDGHHRISVARSLGAAYIEAEVTVWLMTPAATDASPAHMSVSSEAVYA